MTDRPFGRQGPWIFAVMLAAIGFSFTPFFARNLGLNGVEAHLIAFYRFSIVAVVLLPFLGVRWRSIGYTMIGIVVGMAMGWGWIGYVKVLEETTVATAGVIFMSYPVFTLLFAWLLLGRTPGMRGALAAALMVGAGYAVATPELLEELPFQVLLLGLAAPATFGLGITALTGWLSKISPMQRLASIPLGAALGLAPLALKDRQPIDLLPASELLPMLLGLAVVSALIPQFLYVVAAPRIGAIRAAIAGSFELPAMLALGLFIFQEQPTDRELVAVGLVVLAILIVSISRQPKGRPPSV